MNSDSRKPTGVTGFDVRKEENLRAVLYSFRLASFPIINGFEIACMSLQRQVKNIIIFSAWLGGAS